MRAQEALSNGTVISTCGEGLVRWTRSCPATATNRRNREHAVGDADGHLEQVVAGFQFPPGVRPGLGQHEARRSAGRIVEELDVDEPDYPVGAQRSVAVRE